MSDEPTHKMVNGVRIELTEEEKAQIKADWAEGRKRQEAKRAEHEKRKEQRQKLLERLGITEEEAQLLRGL